MSKSFPRHGLLLTALAMPLLLAGCENIEKKAQYPTGADRSATGGNIYAEPESIFGEDGLKFGSKEKKTEDSGIGVNSFLWRASLDTVSFMPLASADPFGGVILTDWYSPAETSGERVKINVFILGRELRSDGIRVRVFKQEKLRGDWRDTQTSAETVRQLEDAILTRARQLRIAGLDK